MEREKAHRDQVPSDMIVGMTRHSLHVRICSTVYGGRDTSTQDVSDHILEEVGSLHVEVSREEAILLEQQPPSPGFTRPFGRADR